MLSRYNEAMVHARNEQMPYDTMCTITASKSVATDWLEWVWL